MVTVADIAHVIEDVFPLSLQESYDNCGLQVGNPESVVDKVLYAIDVTEDVLDEAVEKKCQMIISHHPLLFRGMKNIVGRTYEERCVQKAIKHDIALYAAHTNLDNSLDGLNGYWANEMGLKNIEVIAPINDLYEKLVVYVPVSHADNIREAMRIGGCGVQGNYNNCSFAYKGEGRFMASDGANPYCGTLGKLHVEKELAVTTMVLKSDRDNAINVIKKTHPYEEPAIDIFPLRYNSTHLGAGVIGDLEEPIEISTFFNKMKKVNKALANISLSKAPHKMISRVAYCGGSGAFLWKNACAKGAQLFITGEAKYNDYYDVQGLICLAVIGHYESELIALETLNKVISSKISKFAAEFSERSSNPIDYIKI